MSLLVCAMVVLRDRSSLKRRTRLDEEEEGGGKGAGGSVKRRATEGEGGEGGRKSLSFSEEGFRGGEGTGGSELRLEEMGRKRRRSVGEEEEGEVNEGEGLEGMNPRRSVRVAERRTAVEAEMEEESGKEDVAIELSFSAAVDDSPASLRTKKKAAPKVHSKTDLTLFEVRTEPLPHPTNTGPHRKKQKPLQNCLCA